jgi:hypothetical protein
VKEKNGDNGVKDLPFGRELHDDDRMIRNVNSVTVTFVTLTCYGGDHFANNDFIDSFRIVGNPVF